MAYVLTAPVGAWSAGVPRQFERYAIAQRPFRSGAGLGAWGLGDAAQTVGQVGSAAGPVVVAAAVPAVAAALGISVAIAAPVVGAVFAGILFGVEAILHSGCGQTCVATSQWANEAELLLQQNIAKYFSLGVRTATDRQSALNIFDAVWAGLVQRCSQPGLSTAGRNCVEDRRAGACKWHADADSRYPGGPKRGDCWNWFNGYRDPIAHDNGVVSSSSAVVSALSASLPGGSGSLGVLALIGGLVLLGVLL